MRSQHIQYQERAMGRQQSYIEIAYTCSGREATEPDSTIPAVHLATEIAFADKQYQYRQESLLGVDDIITDVVALLEKKGVLNNTYSKSVLSSLTQW